MSGLAIEIRRATFIVLLAALFLAGCAGFPLIGGPGAGRYPEACDDWGFPERQCKAIAASAVDRADADPEEIAEIWLLPFETGSEANLGGRQIARVEVKLVDGRGVTHDVWCGISFSPVCDPNAELHRVLGDRSRRAMQRRTTGRLRHAATDCRRPRRSRTPSALEVEALDIPIDKEGRYEVEVGRATLPNGYLTERSMSVVDRRPTGFWADSVRLEVHPDDPDRPPVGSIYREPFDGPEPVTVLVVVEVTEFEEPSTLQLRDIVVR